MEWQKKELREGVVGMFTGRAHQWVFAFAPGMIVSAAKRVIRGEARTGPRHWHRAGLVGLRAHGRQQAFSQLLVELPTNLDAAIPVRVQHEDGAVPATFTEQHVGP